MEGLGMNHPSFWNGKKVFLTGCTGFKGTWLSLWLEKLGAEVFGFSLPPPTSPSFWNWAGLSSRVEFQEGNICNGAMLIEFLAAAKPDIVFHLAAQPLVRDSYIDPVGTYETNVMGTVNLLQAIRQTPSVRSVVVVTTDKCYENREWAWGYRETDPMGGYDPYSNSKGCAELVTQAFRSSFFNAKSYGITHRTAIGSARAGNVIGGGDFAKDRLIPDMIRALQAGDRVKIRSPHAIRPWQHVLEPLSGYLDLAKALYENGMDFAEGWNFGPYDQDAKPVEWIVKKLTGMLPGSAGYEIDSNPQPHEATYLKLDISKAKARLEWAPRWNLEMALKKSADWFLAPPESILDFSLEQIRQYEDTVPS